MKRYLIAGLLVLVPLVITIWVISLIISAMDQTLLWLPSEWQPENLFGQHIPGSGVILTVITVLITGVIATNIVGQKAVTIWDRFLNHIPIVRSVYGSVKQVSDTIFSDKSLAFREAVLVEYPRRDLWTIAFRTGVPDQEITTQLDAVSETTCIYVPTTPNPTSGFFLIVANCDLKPLSMSVDEAFKYIISMGVAPPSDKTLRETTDE